MKLQCAHWRDLANTGDMASTPAQYMGWDAEHIHLNDATHVDPADAVLVGGGGVVYANGTRWLAENHPGPKIAWGIGVNRMRRRWGDSYPEYLSTFALVGGRDWNIHGLPKENWVPCASCLSPLFDQEYPITRNVVAYLHGPIADIADVPGLHCCKRLDLKTILEYLGSARTVVSSSYHGIYWATLLGRRVVIVPAADSSRFFCFKHRWPIVNQHNWRKSLPECPEPYTEALAECRKANLAFADRVQALLFTAGCEGITKP